MKRCTKCGIEQPLENFYRAPTSRDGLRGDCKACFAARAAARYAANPEPTKARVRRWQRENADRVKAHRDAVKASGKRSEQNRRSHLKRKYGITPEQYDALLRAQGGGCAICGRAPRPDIALHVDHDHETGAIRGLICFRCNNALGDFADDTYLLRRAAAYLEGSGQDPFEVAEELVLIRRRVEALKAA